MTKCAKELKFWIGEQIFTLIKSRTCCLCCQKSYLLGQTNTCIKIVNSEITVHWCQKLDNSMKHRHKAVLDNKDEKQFAETVLKQLVTLQTHFTNQHKFSFSLFEVITFINFNSHFD